MDSTILAAVVTLVGAIGAIVAQIFDRRYSRAARRDAEIDSIGGTDQIEALIQSLNTANDVIQGIEMEIRERAMIAEKLKADATQAEKLLELNREQLEAVRGLVGSEFRRESKRSFWLGALLNFMFFIAGVGLTLALR